MTDIAQRIAALSPEKRELLLRQLNTIQHQQQEVTPLPVRQSLIKPVSREQPLPLSFAQQRLWFLDQLEPQSASYNMPSLLRLTGWLRVDALERSLAVLVQRHEVLRTTFDERSGRPVQVIAPKLPVQGTVIDLRGLDTAERNLQVNQLARAEAWRSFDLVNGPLLRVCLLRLASQEHVLVFTLHHIVTDGWSTGILNRELSELYSAFIEGRPSTLSPLPIQYADYALWQREWLKGEVLQKQLDYWRQKLTGAPSVLSLPTDRPRPAVQTSVGAAQTLVLPLRLLRELKQLSQREGATLFMTLLAAFQILLMRYSGVLDVVVGSSIANRKQQELESLIGLFATPIVLRTDLSGNPTFLQLLARVREVALQAYVHQDLPFEKLVEELQPQRDLSRQPWFQVLFNLQNTPQSLLELPGLDCRPVLIENQTAKFDLTLELTETETGLRCVLEYNTDLFEADTIRRMQANFQTLLEGVIQSPQAHISDLPLLSSAERRQVLALGAGPTCDYPEDQCVHQLFEQQVEQNPDAVALIFEEKQVTYHELNRRANQLAHHLLGEGVGPEVLVGVCMERSLELVVALLAVLKAGGAYVPLDQELPQERFTFLLEDAQVSIVLTQTHRDRRDSALRLSDHRGKPDGYVLPMTVKTICLDSGTSVSHLEHTDNPKLWVQPKSQAYMIYTSGSTGKPKGTMNTHHGLCNRLLWMQETYQLTPRDRVLQKTPFSFDVSVWEFFWPLLTGASLIVARPRGHQDPVYLKALIAEQAVSTLHFVPSMLQAFLGEQNLQDCESLRHVICSGEALTASLQVRFFAHVTEGVKLHNLYGPTEAAIDVTFWECQRDRRDSALRLSDHRGKPDGYRVPIGRPIANTQIYLLDADLQPVPIGIPGELYIGGVGLARGYFKRPDLTAEKFIANPFGEIGGERLYRTGDLALYRADGAIEFLGRIDQQVKLRGFRIELGEIEATLQAHPAVQETVVVLHEEEEIGHYLVAYVALAVSPPEVQHAEQPTQEELQSYLRKQLPDYMVPAIFVYMETLPLTPNGKVNRKALPVPERTVQRFEGHVAPQSELEQRLAKIWQQVLPVRTQVGIYDNFFDLGGHSLLLIRVCSKLQAYLGYEVSMVDLFRYPTIHALSTHLSEQQEQQPLLQPIAARVQKRKEALQKSKSKKGRKER